MFKAVTFIIFKTGRIQTSLIKTGKDKRGDPRHGIPLGNLKREKEETIGLHGNLTCTCYREEAGCKGWRPMGAILRDVLDTAKLYKRRAQRVPGGGVREVWANIASRLVYKGLISGEPSIWRCALRKRSWSPCGQHPPAGRGQNGEEGEMETHPSSTARQLGCLCCAARAHVLALNTTSAFHGVQLPIANWGTPQPPWLRCHIL